MPSASDAGHVELVWLVHMGRVLHRSYFGGREARIGEVLPILRIDIRLVVFTIQIFLLSYFYSKDFKFICFILVFSLV